MLEPGELYEIKYGKGHRLQLRALGMRQKRRLLEIVSSIDSLEASSSGKVQLYELMESALVLCVPDATEQLLDSLNEEMAMDIIAQAMRATAVSEDEAKKSESLPSSDAANSVVTAGQPAEA